MIRVAVAGATGYVGGELLRLLLAHPAVTIGALTADATAGSRLGDHHPQLAPLADVMVQPTTAETLGSHDVVILALPYGASASIAERLGAIAGGPRLVVDCGADHRLADPADWARGYDGAHPGCWPYGLPELADGRTRLAGASRVAVPGCFPTAVGLALSPAVAEGLITGTDVVVVAATGTSGAGRAPRVRLLASEVIGSASAYAVAGTHRHVGEIEQVLRMAGAAAARVSFTPVLVPMTRGILATCTAPVDHGVDVSAARSAYQKATAEEPFWQLLPAGQWPTTQAVLGSNAAQVQVALDDRAGRLVAVCAIDNLTKGTAGGAIQSMNVALDLPETAALARCGIAP